MKSFEGDLSQCFLDIAESDTYSQISKIVQLIAKKKSRINILWIESQEEQNLHNNEYIFSISASYHEHKKQSLDIRWCSGVILRRW